MTRVVRVLVDGASGLEFDYLVPHKLEDQVVVGSRIRVPLRNRSSTGTVVAFVSDDDSPVKRTNLKPIHDLISNKPILTSELINLGRWISNYYMASMESVMRCLIPESVRGENHDFKKQLFVKLQKKVSDEEVKLLSKKAPKQANILSELKEVGMPLSISQLGDGARSCVESLKKKGLVNVTNQILQRDPHAEDQFIPSKPLILTEAQQVCLNKIIHAIREPKKSRPILLHGITGSGKTEVYLQAISSVIERGQTALVLVPEISLTPQTVARFKRRFAHIQNQVAVLHSHLSGGERFDEWHKIVDENAKIVIGARSALFAPLKNLGLIVVDEEHEGSYKQDKSPRYHARDVAVVRSKMEGCVVVLGSATPSLESIHNTNTGKYELIELKERVDNCSLPLIRIIDLKNESRNLSKSGGPAIISERLRTAVNERLKKGEQTILFLNRRGFATSLSCPSCGHVCGCSECSVSLTFHRKEEKLICHMCGYQQAAPKKCPECKEPAIRFAGFGTEKVEEVLRKVFPSARIARVDTDTMSRKGALRKTLGDFKAVKIDILVGTQMIAKGLHFPNVTLVGILNADIGLHIPDFRSGERTFQLLTQVAGRAGRGELKGEVFIQTFTPQSPSVQFARHHDYAGFSDQELEFRKSFSYPPFYHCIILTCRSQNSSLAEFTLQTLHKRLLKNLPTNIILGEPLPSPLSKASGQFRFQLMLRAVNPRSVNEYIKSIIEGLAIPDEVYLAIDVDPLYLS